MGASVERVGKHLTERGLNTELVDTLLQLASYVISQLRSGFSRGTLLNIMEKKFQPQWAQEIVATASKNHDDLLLSHLIIAQFLAGVSFAEIRKANLPRVVKYLVHEDMSAARIDQIIEAVENFTVQSRLGVSAGDLQQLFLKQGINPCLAAGIVDKFRADVAKKLNQDFQAQEAEPVNENDTLGCGKLV
ncbi:MAG: hypothetical protein HQL90_04955 [Magnetococcales bacterium]|nr:hypothetical protein [Magnetococcales bacterium]